MPDSDNFARGVDSVPEDMSASAGPLPEAAGVQMAESPLYAWNCSSMLGNHCGLFSLEAIIDEAVIALDRDLVIRRINALAGPLVGVTARDMGRPLSATPLALVEPAIEALCTAVLSSGSPMTHSFTAYHRSLKLRILPIIGRNAVVSAIAIVAMDISDMAQAVAATGKAEIALRLARSREQAVLDSMSAHVALLSPDGTIISINETWRRATCGEGFQGAGATLGSNYLAICAKAEGANAKTGAAIADGLRRVLAGVQREFSTEYSCYTERKPRWFRLIATPFNQHEIGGAVVMHVDITTAKLLEERLQRAEAMARAASDAKSRFLANISHEFRTPLNAIIGFAEVISGEAFGPMGNERYVDYVRSIGQSGLHLLGIVTQILDVTRIEAGKLELNEAAVDVTNCIDTVVAMMRPQTEAQGIALNVGCARTLPTLLCDATQFRQMLINLIDNARKFTPAGGRIDVTLSVDDTGAMTVAVSDTGIGMTPQETEIALQPFGQAGTPLLATNQGLGLGLPIVAQLMRLHGGALNVASEKGVGSTMTLRFPASRSLPAKGEASNAAGH